MTSTAASPLPIPFSRSPTSATHHQRNYQQHHHQHQHHSQSLYYSPATRPPTVVANPGASGHTTSLSSSASSTSSSLSSSNIARTPETPTEETAVSMPALPAPMPAASGSATETAAKIKSTAAKRANAKAAAANKKAQQQQQQQAAAATNCKSNTTTSPGSSGDGTSGSGGSPTPTPGLEDKKDWIVPQRAKPGRKPSQEEPLTKRQAQNRASQRAFRERKQNHVATLEAKVAEYEAEKLTRDAQEEVRQRHLVQENDALKSDNAAMKGRVAELEDLVRQLRLQLNSQASAAPPVDSRPSRRYEDGPSASAYSAGPPGDYFQQQQQQQHRIGSATSPSGCLHAGCRAPSHEAVPLGERRKRPLPSRTPSSGQHSGNGNVDAAYHYQQQRHDPQSPMRSGPPNASGHLHHQQQQQQQDQMYTGTVSGKIRCTPGRSVAAYYLGGGGGSSGGTHQQQQQQQQQHPHDPLSTSRFGAMSIAATSPPFVLGMERQSSLLQLQPSFYAASNNNGSSRNSAAGAMTQQSHNVDVTENDDDDFDLNPSSSVSNRHRSPSSPGLLMPADDIDMDRDCGFCTDSTPCLCRGEAVLDLTAMDDDDDHNSSADASGDTASGDTTNGGGGGWLDSVDQMVKIEEEEDGDDVVLRSDDLQTSGQAATVTSYNARAHVAGLSSDSLSVPTRPAVAISSLLSTKARKSDAGASSKPKLWSTTTAPVPQSSQPQAPLLKAASAATAVAAASEPSKSSAGKKLWWTQPLSSTGTVSRSSSALYVWTPNAVPDDDIDDEEEEDYSYEDQQRQRGNATMDTEDADAMCSGDPSNCPACNADPVLAAFCEAVGDGDGAGPSEESEPMSIDGAGIVRRHSLASSGATEMTMLPPPVQQVQPMQYNKTSTSSSREDGSWRAPPTLPPPPKSSAFTFSVAGPAMATVSSAGSTSSSSSRPLMPGRSITTGSTPLGAVNSHHNSYTSGYAQHQHQGYSIPDAFRQIRSHPGFPKWRGGLNLLADVVSGRGPTAVLASTSSASASSSANAAHLNPGYQAQTEEEKRRVRHPSVEIIASSERKIGLAESGDRHVAHHNTNTTATTTTTKRSSASGGSAGSAKELGLGASAAAGTSPPPLGNNDAITRGTAGSPHSTSSTSRIQAGNAGSGLGEGEAMHNKRRRLYLENDRVEEALRLLDYGILGKDGAVVGATGGSGSGSSSGTASSSRSQQERSSLVTGSTPGSHRGYSNIAARGIVSSTSSIAGVVGSKARAAVAASGNGATKTAKDNNDDDDDDVDKTSPCPCPWAQKERGERMSGDS